MVAARHAGRSIGAGGARPALALLAAASLASCSETVGFLDVQLAVPSWDPAIQCDADPRRVQRMTIGARCDDGQVATDRKSVV